MQISPRIKKTIACSLNVLALAAILFFNTYFFYLHYRGIKTSPNRGMIMSDLLKAIQFNETAKKKKILTKVVPELKSLYHFNTSSGIQSACILGSSIFLCLDQLNYSLVLSLGVLPSWFFYYLFYSQNEIYWNSHVFGSYLLRNFIFVALLCFVPIAVSLAMRSFLKERATNKI